MNENPLVSVVVITYNSAKTVLETLDSIAAQTYKNIELIISDDCSKDETVSLCETWLSNNSERFVRSLIVRTTKNSGVAPNVNNGIFASSGEWIKSVAGDDGLLSDAIENYVSYINTNPGCRIAYAKLHFFGNDKDRVKNAKLFYEKQYESIIKGDYETQFRAIHSSLFLPGPGVFVNRSLYDEVSGYDERYPFCEEYPFTYYVLEKGEKIHFVDKECYLYRIRTDSLCRQGQEKVMLHPRVFRDQYRFVKEVLFWKSIKHGFAIQGIKTLLTYYSTSSYYETPNFAKRYLLNFLRLAYRMF